MDTDYDALWARVVSEATTDINGIHGRSHWQKVERGGLLVVVFARSRRWGWRIGSLRNG